MTTTRMISFLSPRAATAAAWSAALLGAGLAHAQEPLPEGPSPVEAAVQRDAIAAGQHAGGTLGVIAAYEAALEFDPKYRSAREEFEGSKEYRVLGRSNLLPQVSASAYRNHNRLKSDVAQPTLTDASARGRSDRAYFSDNASLQLRQPLINFDALARWRQGDLQSLYGEALFALRGNELILRLSEAYTNVLMASEQLRLARSQVDAFSEQVAASERLFKLGEGTRTDVLEAQSSLKLGQAQVIEGQAALDSARASLVAITGPTAQALPVWQAEKFKALDLQLHTLAEWEDAAKRHSIEIAARELSVRVAQEEVSKAEAGHKPRLDLVAGLSNTGSDNVNTVGSNYRQKYYGLQLSVPLYSGGAVSAQVRQAVAGAAKAQADLDDTRGSVIVELRKQFAAVEGGALKVEALESAAESAALQLDATRKSVTAGARINLDVLRALQQQTSTARDLSQARFNYALAWLRLRSAAGLLTAGDLGEVAVQLQQPAPAAATAAQPSASGS